MWRSAVQLCLGLPSIGGLAQLARAPALQAGGQRFESVILHPARCRHYRLQSFFRQRRKDEARPAKAPTEPRRRVEARGGAKQTRGDTRHTIYGILKRKRRETRAITRVQAESMRPEGKRRRRRTTSEVCFPCSGENERTKGRTVDALAPGGDEGRDKLRKAAGRCK